MPADEAIEVDFWFDPFCPWAWITSRWMHEVRRQRSVRIRWRLMSLAVLNEGRDLPVRHRVSAGQWWGPVRVCAAAEQRAGSGVLDRLYTELGTRFHHEQAPKDRATMTAALVAAGLDPDLAGAMDSTDFDVALRESHHEGMSRVGEDVGTPVVAIGKSAFFGPVVTPMPRGDAALRLWDGVLLLATTDCFYELKRTRDRAPVFS